MNGISVLIPVYNDDPTALLKELYTQCAAFPISIEIIVMDDASTDYLFGNWNKEFNTPIITIHRSETNIGRAAIRNELIKKASFDWLLFLDADTLPCQKNYLSTYLPFITGTTDAVCGGTAYRMEAPAPDKSLRWVFGKAREERTAQKRNKHPFENFTLNNLLIRKEVMQQFPLDNTIQTYGHEDTLLGMHLKAANSTIVHTDNFVYHEGLDTNAVFLTKVKESVHTLVDLYTAKKLPADTKLIRLHKQLKPIGLNHLAFLCIKPFIHSITKKLLGPNPSLLLLDIFKFYTFEFYLTNKNKS